MERLEIMDEFPESLHLVFIGDIEGLTDEYSDRMVLRPHCNHQFSII